jgi:hypothetical protein
MVDNMQVTTNYTECPFVTPGKPYIASPVYSEELTTLGALVENMVSITDDEGEELCVPLDAPCDHLDGEGSWVVVPPKAEDDTDQQ